LPDLPAALGGLAGVSFSLMLVGLAGAAVSLWSLLRLRQHYRVAEAAERLEPVRFNYVVRRYVPRAQRSHQRAEEILLAKQGIAARMPGWKRWALMSAVVAVAFAGVTAFLGYRNLRALPAPRIAARPQPKIEALTAIQGVWGWRADFQQSCAQNPQSISLSADRRKLSVHYAKPLATGSEFDFNIVSAQPDGLVLSGPISSARPASVTIRFLDADTYVATNSERPLGSTGVIERCR
jgi:hypothetical protein